MAAGPDLFLQMGSVGAAATAAARGYDLNKSRDGTGKTPPPRRKGGRDVGAALKTAYERTLREDIPPDLLDLLGKLD